MNANTKSADSPIGELLGFDPALIRVPRTPEGPAPQEVYMAMEEGVPYTASELSDEFYCSRWTIKSRLDDLAEQGFLEKKKHGHNTVTYWIPK